MKADIIAADCPWNWSAYSAKGEGRSAKRHYSVMTLDRIKALQVKEIASPDCALFMWATSPMMPQAFETMSAWGFQFSTIAFTWAKLTKRAYRNWQKWQKQGVDLEEVMHRLFFMGNGYMTRANTEYVLLGRFPKGEPYRINKGVRSLVVTPIRDHSHKPDEVRDRIVQLLGPLPRVELFARDTAPGWISVGDKITGREIEEDIRLIAAR